MKKIILSLIAVFSITAISSAQLTILSDGATQGNGALGVLRIKNTQSNYIDIGPQNATWCHLQTNLNYFYFNKRITLGTGEIEGYANKNILLCAGPNSSGNYARLTILSSNGYVGIGQNYSPSYLLDVNGSIRTTGTYVTSDSRLKKDIKNLEKSKINNIYKLAGKTYTKDLLPDNNTIVPLTQNDSIPSVPVIVQDTTHQIGFLAQDIKVFFPELVKEDKDGYYSVDYSSLIPVLVEALKEQNLRIAVLEKKLNEKIK